MRRPFVRRREGPHSSSADRIKAIRIYVFKSETLRGFAPSPAIPLGASSRTSMDPGLPSVWSDPKLILLTSFHARRSSGLLTATAFSFGV